MIKYDDFAMPSLENIENMAKAYSKMEKEFLQNKSLNKEDSIVVQKIYDNLFNSNEMISMLYAIYPKNRKFSIIGESLARIKNTYESDFINFSLNLPNEKYSFSESTIVYDLIKIWLNCITLFVNKIKNANISKKYINDLIFLINELIKY